MYGKHYPPFEAVKLFGFFYNGKACLFQVFKLIPFFESGIGQPTPIVCGIPQLKLFNRLIRKPTLLKITQTNSFSGICFKQCILKISPRVFTNEVHTFALTSSSFFGVRLNSFLNFNIVLSS